ncbi:hypothetical protein MCHIJ_13570 [Mycolicibacterium chitae]|uniref:Oxidoreductase, FAD-linked n=1 Tax=Mycolicibacterium chitae TaxID=1792 RepID=A0A448IEP0_MYCCI|nr:hypothetical protein [Mycolicibacterium chitae]MCV7104716.1 hypothetical protein [Mycolicibacterium chitae]BBZ01920.1 hypothetical protein MCHIJ_13570 [Mycolicibacterium chitae]VEG50747.1 oxidoreductase, FAD-linked [Mycolicibacterium chitae]
MAQSIVTARIDDAAPGDILALDRGAGEQTFKVVHKEPVETGFLITLEGNDGETCQLEMAAGTPVKRSLEAKWESTQSPTPNAEP